MFIHQEATKDYCEGFINLDNISYISKKKYDNGCIVYKCYLIGDIDPLTITQETFDKIIAERGVV